MKTSFGLYIKWKTILFKFFKNIPLGNKRILKKLNIEENIKNELIKIVEVKLPPKLLEIKCTFKLICFTFDGIDSIKEALINGKQFATDNISIIYKSLGAPLYECIIYTYNENDGIYLMDESLNEVQNTIEKNGGTYILEKEPYVVYPKNNKFWYLIKKVFCLKLKKKSNRYSNNESIYIKLKYLIKIHSNLF